MNKILLPIDPHLPSIQSKILSDQPVILCASPGSGKTTRVPADLLLALQKKGSTKKIIVIVPKRISALSAATRVADENNWQLGVEVGYAVRFENKTQDSTQLIYMTDGLFLKKCLDPNFLKSVGYVFLDEFHERKINIDLSLGLLLEQKILFNNLQVIVMSATMNIEQLQKYFGQCHTIDIKAPPYKITQHYLGTGQRLNCDEAFYESLKKTVLSAVHIAQKDILIFLPGLREILKAQDILRPALPQVQLFILHGSLSIDEQKKIVQKQTQQRRIILATNIAESSITLTDLDCVIDSGLEKTNLIEKKMGFSQLITQRISLFSTLQREGRAARTQDGHCFKLWHQVDERSMPELIEPEVYQLPLYQEILFLLSLGQNDVQKFSWIDPPKKTQIQVSLTHLKQWHLLDEHFQITEMGKLISQSPVNIVNSVLFIELCRIHDFKIEKVKEFADLIARLESIENTNGQKHSSSHGNDIERLLSQPTSFNHNKLTQQLSQFAKEIRTLKSLNAHVLKIDPESSLSFKLFKIYSYYFPYRIVAKKSGATGLSSLGRGTELSSESAAQNFEFYAALTGFEKNDSTTIIRYAAGLSKIEALKILQENSQHVENIFFDDQSQEFFRQETTYFGSFKLNEKSKERLSLDLLRRTWKKYVTQNSQQFLQLNETYKKLVELLNFIQSKHIELNLKLEDFSFLETLDLKLCQKLTDVIDDFEEFKTVDLQYYLNEIVPENICEYLNQLPRSIKLPSGKTVFVNYSDPKSPMISAKIQDCFGWNKTPEILSGKLKMTLELLAPNMRPTQTTNDLAYFWKNSYIDVRKDLRARYPKHAWPEDPTKI